MNIEKDVDKFVLKPLDLKTHFIKKYQEALITINQSYARSDPSLIYFSLTGLNDALDEAVKDIEILKHRRKEFERFTRGKIAGIVVFRLSRWNLINTNSDLLLKDRLFLKMNYFIALAIGLNYINISYTQINEYVRNEIMYTLMRRHVNQETLGVVFDTLRDKLK